MGANSRLTLILINTVPSTDKWDPFLTPSLEQCISFNLCTVFKILINDKNRKCSRLFQSHKMHVLGLLGKLWTPKVRYLTGF